MAIVVREITPDDAEALAHIIVTATRSNFAGLVPDRCLSWLSEDERAICSTQALTAGADPVEALTIADEAKSAANWRQSLTEERGSDEIRLAAEQDGLVVGFAMGDSCDDPVYRGEITSCYVHPTHQGQGIGRCLLNELASRFAARGILSLRVGVLRINPMRAFYERLGGQYLYDRDYHWDGVLVAECVYGWKDTQELQQGVSHDD